MTDKELVRYTRDFRKGLIGNSSSWLMCMAVCAPLRTLLEMAGVPVRLTECEVELKNGDLLGHYFLTLPDGRILDPTADQFFGAVDGAPKLPRVYLGGMRTWYQPL